MTHFSDVVNAAMDVNKAKKEIMRTNENRLMKADGLRNRISQSWLLMENEMGFELTKTANDAVIRGHKWNAQADGTIHSLSMYIYFPHTNIEPEK